MIDNLWRAVIIAILCAALVSPARANDLDRDVKLVIAGIVIVSAGVAVAVTYVVLHQKHKITTITGCVGSGAGGMTLTSDKDRQVYMLSGDPVGLKPGERMTFEGKRKTVKNAPVFEAHSVRKDLGVCQP